ncbi:hypothetical protein RIF29_38235 [Crotalaria pallida]|uniref:Uncharacterized protein n=1 Tax=Crotalaria pallida TaxID=3830 RepID=A0AAN9DYT8_CROPI
MEEEHKGWEIVWQLVLGEGWRRYCYGVRERERESGTERERREMMMNKVGDDGSSLLGSRFDARARARRIVRLGAENAVKAICLGSSARA